jgi:hypothetical protein
MAIRCRRSYRLLLRILILTGIGAVWSENKVDDPAVERHRRLAQQQYLRGGKSTASRQIGNQTSTFESSSSNILPQATATLPLHSKSGTHHVFLYVGSPPQRQTMIVDTGSRLIAFPCKPCSSCGKHASTYFDPALSSTVMTPSCGSCRLPSVSHCSEFNTEKCVMSQKYTEGSSWHAFEVEDIIWFGSNDVHDGVEHTGLMRLAVPYTFGCQTSTSGLFRNQYADGIFGIGLHEESSILKALYDSKAIGRKTFSLCFTRNGGQLSLGGTAVQQHHKDVLRFVPLNKNNGFYSLKVTRLHVGDICITCGKYKSALSSFRQGKGTILDSGTTDTFLPEAVATSFAKAWKNVTSGMNYFKSRTRFYTFSEFSTLPDIVMTFEGNVTLTIQPERYMENVLVHPSDDSLQPWKGTRQLTNRIYLDEPAGAVLGANAMIGHDFLFDMQERRVGWARADCRFVETSSSTTRS